MINSDLVIKAKAFAKARHKGQERKFEGLPYYIHPKRVAKILYQFKVSSKIDELIAAAFLHDTVEDTETTIQEVKELFGPLVAQIVQDVTSDATQVQMLGKKEYLANKMINMSRYALTLKLADRIDNVNRILWGPEKFRDKYVEETLYIMDRLTQERKLTNTQKKMVKEIETHLDELIAADDVDYLSFDSYHKRGKGEV